MPAMAPPLSPMLLPNHRVSLKAYDQVLLVKCCYQNWANTNVGGAYRTLELLTLGLNLAAAKGDLQASGVPGVNATGVH